MSRKSHRVRGGQIGNQNGLKHGFYSKPSPIPQEEDVLLPEGDADELTRAIAITRRTIRSILKKEPFDDKLLSYNISLLIRLVRTRRLISGSRSEEWRQDVEKLAEHLSITSGPNPQGGSC